MEFQTGDPVTINNLGAMALLDGDWGKALEQFRRAAEASPDFEGAWLNIAEVYSLVGMAQRQKALLERVVCDHPDSEAAAAANSEE